MVKEGDRGELRKSKKGSVQSFLAASVSEASELSLSQIILFSMKTFCVAFSVEKLVLLAMCSCCLSQLPDLPGRSCAGYFFMLKREFFKHKQGGKKVQLFAEEKASFLEVFENVGKFWAISPSVVLM